MPSESPDSWHDRLSDHLPELTRRAGALARNPADAEDLVQETCLRALSVRKRPTESLRAWLLAIMDVIWTEQRGRQQRAREMSPRRFRRLP